VISSKIRECGSNGRTIPLFLMWLDSTMPSGLTDADLEDMLSVPFLPISSQQHNSKVYNEKQKHTDLHVNYVIHVKTNHLSGSWY
jgi:hypothetical protein